MKYHIITYGCQMNKSDSERIAAVLEKCGYSPTLDKNKADLVVINVCSVRQSAIDRIYGLISNLKNKKSKTQIKNQKIILTGCMLTKDKEKLKDKVNFILDIKDLQGWPEIISKFKIQNSKLQLKTKNYLEIQPHYSTFPIAYVPIMTGCNNFCAYCVVPYTRGREISRPAEEIICEVKELIKKGYKMIILLGQNVNSYHSRISTNPSRTQHQSEARCWTSPAPERSSRCGVSQMKKENIRDICGQIREDSRETNISDISGKFVQIRDCNFPKLLKMVNDLTGDFWLTFITSHPKPSTRAKLGAGLVPHRPPNGRTGAGDFSWDELIETMAKCEKIMPYLHLPVQSGDNKILKKMNRHYTVSHYKKLIRDIRGKFAEISEFPISISTDIIVGFPGETKKQFENIAKLMREIKFDMAYLAKYSPRSGTAAEKLKDDVSLQEKERRWKALSNILEKTALEKKEKYLNKTIEVLIIKQNGVWLFGYTKNFKNIKLLKNQSVRSLVGNFVQVKIKKVVPWGLKGRLVA